MLRSVEPGNGNACIVVIIIDAEWDVIVMLPVPVVRSYERRFHADYSDYIL